MRALISSLVAGGLLAASTASAATAPAIGDSRIASPVQSSEQASDDMWLWIGGGVVLLAILLFVVLDDDDEDVPTSP